MQKNVFKYLVFFIAILCIVYFYKKMQAPNNTTPIEDESSELVYENSLPDDFHKFYDLYHTDSIFQLEHTIFPLKGLARSADTTKIAEEVLWQKEDWIQHKPFNDQNGTFERTFTNIGGIITEYISANEGLFSLEKRYAKLGEDWFLIYYQELLMHG